MDHLTGKIFCRLIVTVAWKVFFFWLASTHSCKPCLYGQWNFKNHWLCQAQNFVHPYIQSNFVFISFVLRTGWRDFQRIVLQCELFKVGCEIHKTFYDMFPELMRELLVIDENLYIKREDKNWEGIWDFFKPKLTKLQLVANFTPGTNERK